MTYHSDLSVSRRIRDRFAGRYAEVSIVTPCRQEEGKRRFGWFQDRMHDIEIMERLLHKVEWQVASMVCFEAGTTFPTFARHHHYWMAGIDSSEIGTSVAHVTLRHQKFWERLEVDLSLLRISRIRTPVRTAFPVAKNAVSCTFLHDFAFYLTSESSTRRPKKA